MFPIIILISIVLADEISAETAEKTLVDIKKVRYLTVFIYPTFYSDSNPRGLFIQFKTMNNRFTDLLDLTHYKNYYIF